MNVQARTNREAGLDDIMEAMDTPKSEGRLSRSRLANPDGTECDHCKGSGHHHDNKGKQTECDKCGGDGWIDAKVVKEAPKPCPKCGKVHTINASCGKPHSEDTSRYINNEANPTDAQGRPESMYGKPNFMHGQPAPAEDAGVRAEIEQYLSTQPEVQAGVLAILDKHQGTPTDSNVDDQGRVQSMYGKPNFMHGQP